MQNDVTEKLQNELANYTQNKSEFTPYYPGMNVLSSNLYKEQLIEVVELMKKDDEADASAFMLYLDTIIINMHTKLRKYKKSIYFDDDNIKDIQNQGYTIPFYIDEKKKINVILGLVKS